MCLIATYIMVNKNVAFFYLRMYLVVKRYALIYSHIFFVQFYSLNVVYFFFRSILNLISSFVSLAFIFTITFSLLRLYMY